MDVEEPSGLQHPSSAEIQAWVRAHGREISLDQHRVSVYSVATANQMGLPFERLRQIRLTVLTGGLQDPTPQEWRLGKLTAQEEQIISLAQWFERQGRGTDLAELPENARPKCKDEEVLQAFLVVEKVLQPMDRS